jgi:Asp-tRNA(Asn)/Glu-tRNA(Gln) amidotransferase A subunit family amidase
VQATNIATILAHVEEALKEMETKWSEAVSQYLSRIRQLGQQVEAYRGTTHPSFPETTEWSNEDILLILVQAVCRRSS